MVVVVVVNSSYCPVLQWIHQANPIDDSYLSEITARLFPEPQRANFDGAMKRSFEDVYGMEWTVFRDIRNFMQMPDHPSAARLFRWLIAYLIRFHRWREDRMIAVKDATRPHTPRNHTRRIEMIRNITTVDEAYKIFCELLQKMTSEMKAHNGISEHAHTLLKFTITGLNALIRSSKVKCPRLATPFYSRRFPTALQKKKDEKIDKKKPKHRLLVNLD
ncbi:hypothetical protein F4860DRAFT_216576 [Xylaria cubensis]|nr:hypothetical protein F4860DRAFT_216576 [Xylaria cubensis]